MEHAPGISLHQRWPTMEIGEQFRCIKALYRKLEEVVRLKFLGYGSLYFDDTEYITASKIPLDQEYCIGPHCGSHFWNCNVIQPKYYHHVNPNQGLCEFSKHSWIFQTLRKFYRVPIRRILRRPRRYRTLPDPTSRKHSKWTTISRVHRITS